MRQSLRTSVVASACCCLLFSACRGGAVPSQTLTKPAPAPVAAPGVRAITSWAYHPSGERQGFVVDQRAVIALRIDTLTRTDTVSSHAEVTFLALPSANSVGGSVGAFLVQGAGHPAATPAGLTTPFAFRAEYPASRDLQLDFTSPRDAAPCSSVALATAQSLRDLWFRPPDTLRVGTTWQDSASYTACRDGIPLRASVRRTFRVSGTSSRDGRTILQISRASRTSIAGAGAQFGETVTVTGSGNGLLAYDLDPASGEVSAASGNATLDLSLKGRLRTQTVRQAVEIRIGRS